MERLGKSNRRIAALRRARRERPPGRVLVEGFRLVRDLVRWNVPVRELYVAESERDRVERSPVGAAAERAFVVADTVFAGIAATRHPQGVLALVDEPQPVRWEPEQGVALFLDRVQDPGNVGAVIRAAAALRAEAVLLGPGCADPYHPAAVRASAGATFRIAVEPGADPEAAARRVRAVSGSIWAASLRGRDARGWKPKAPVLLLLGSEGGGLDPAVADLADGAVAVPLARGIESLNVAVAAALLLWVAGSSAEG